MPKTKIYDVITNDELELPLALGIVGAKAVSEFTGLTVNRIRKNLLKNSWGRSEFRVVISGLVENNQEKYMIKYNLTHDRTEYFKRRRTNKWTRTKDQKAL